MVGFTVFFSVVIAGMLFADAKAPFTIRNDRKIDVQINDLPMSETLKDLAARIPLEFKGISVGNEIITLNLSSVSLEEILKQLMRGYNYVVIKPESSEKTIVMVLSRAERTKYTPLPPQVNRPPETIASAPPVAHPLAMPAMPSVGIKPPVSGTDPHATTASTDTPVATAPIVSSGQGGISASQTDAAQKKVSDASTPPVSPTLPGREMPPMPPTLPGREMPPMPPGLAEGKSTVPETSPQIPAQVPF